MLFSELRQILKKRSRDSQIYIEGINTNLVYTSADGEHIKRKDFSRHTDGEKVVYTMGEAEELFLKGLEVEFLVYGMIETMESFKPELLPHELDAMYYEETNTIVLASRYRNFCEKHENNMLKIMDLDRLRTQVSLYYNTIIGNKYSENSRLLLNLTNKYKSCFPVPNKVGDLFISNTPNTDTRETATSDVTILGKSNVRPIAIFENYMPATAVRAEDCNCTLMYRLDEILGLIVYNPSDTLRGQTGNVLRDIREICYDLVFLDSYYDLANTLEAELGKGFLDIVGISFKEKTKKPLLTKYVVSDEFNTETFNKMCYERYGLKTVCKGGKNELMNMLYINITKLENHFTLVEVIKKIGR